MYALPAQNDKVGFQVKVTLWLWLMYPPPPQNDKGGSQVKVTLWLWPPPEKLDFVQVTTFPIFSH